MENVLIEKPGKFKIGLNKVKTFFMQPYNVILVIMGILCTLTTIAPIVSIINDTIIIHPGSIDQHLTGKVEGYTFVNYTDLFTSQLAKKKTYGLRYGTPWFFPFSRA